MEILIAIFIVLCVAAALIGLNNWIEKKKQQERQAKYDADYKAWKGQDTVGLATLGGFAAASTAATLAGFKAEQPKKLSKASLSAGLRRREEAKQRKSGSGLGSAVAGAAVGYAVGSALSSRSSDSGWSSSSSSSDSSSSSSSFDSGSSGGGDSGGGGGSSDF